MQHFSFYKIEFVNEFLLGISLLMEASKRIPWPVQTAVRNGF